ncbi:hypothetical protein LCGC14_0543730 [marine sediment metagenome]|uniref:Uncharacterized protein n=1 Tax=marine sediment metagenome TaxID=412755 RepID=A0A0F9RWU7_9ZZZZ
MTLEYKKLTKDEAEDMVNYLKTIAWHEGNRGHFTLGVTSEDRTDEAGNKYLQLRVNIPYKE